MKALLIINGQPPQEMPDVSNYEKIYCTDGAYAFLLGKQIRPDYVIGDFDSVSIDDISPFVEVLERPDQDFTDFEKSLQIIEEHGYDAVDVYGSTGQESDHFLGNLSTALEFKDRLNITFYDDYSIFFFADKSIELEGVQKRIISLIPFHKAKKVNSKGLKFPLNDLDLRLGKRMGTRNYASEDVVEISYESGELIVFISNYEREDDF